jgi:membrane-associated phospholipid phosphatase
MSADFAPHSQRPRGTAGWCLLSLLSSVILLAARPAANCQTLTEPDPQPPSETSLNALPDAPSPQATTPSPATAPAATASQLAVKDEPTLRKTPIHILKDQAAIWSSPAHLHDRDFAYLIPLGLATTLAITTDHQVMSTMVSQNASFNNLNVEASDGLVGGFIAAPVVLYTLGHIHHDDHATETAVLAGEAMVDGLVVSEVLKEVSLRERPMLDNARGRFFQTSVGSNSGFPSTHTMVAWPAAVVIASEYHGPMTQLVAYGLATGVSLTRVLGQQHFPSDVLVGSALGWLVGHYVYRKHSRNYDPQN